MLKLSFSLFIFYNPSSYKSRLIHHLCMYTIILNFYFIINIVFDAFLVSCRFILFIIIRRINDTLYSALVVCFICSMYVITEYKYNYNKNIFYSPGKQCFDLRLNLCCYPQYSECCYSGSTYLNESRINLLQSEKIKFAIIFMIIYLTL